MSDMLSGSGKKQDTATPWSVIFHSIRYLRLSMIYWRVHRAVKGMLIRIVGKLGLAHRVFDRPLPSVSVTEVPRLTSRYHCEGIDLAQLRFSFLRDAETLPSESAAMRTAVAGKPLLWQFHFGYHDYLLAILDEPGTAQEASRRAEEVLNFLALWSRAFPLHSHSARQSAWHPYVLSIRIEAWVRLYAMLLANGIAPEDVRLKHLCEGVERMTRVLLRNLEKGTMANHLLRNIKALVFAGLFLNTTKGAQARRIGLKLLDRELAEQILDDGCHFERSPMYHVSMLNDVLDMAEAMLLSGSTVPDLLSASTERMTGFLEHNRHPDGEIPFFNDSTGSFFLRTDEVLQRGRTLCLELQDAAPKGRNIIAQGFSPGKAAPGTPSRSPERATPPTSAARVSGLLTAQNARAWLVMDAGLVGPDYQPGHAHCDTLSFELSLDGARFITDTGVFHYKESPERSYSRSTAAHNTVEIDGAEQSEVWKSFRVGRRAKIRSFGREERGGVTMLRGVHDGYARLQSGLLHERVMLLAGDWLLIIDWLLGSGVHDYRSFMHFHPDVQLQQAEGVGFFTASRDAAAVQLRLRGEGKSSICETEFYPAFGEKLPRKSLLLEGKGSFPRLLVTEICFGETQPEYMIDGTQVRVTGFGVVSHSPIM